MFIKELFIPAVVVVYGISYYLTTNQLAEESIVFPYFLLALMPVFIVLIVNSVMFGVEMLARQR